ncbi:putative membrane protein [Winogradskyella wandonensis]|uniref:Putative membrane protein n=1 Tax=Winogradskyella wandonensis TaxID=1442586 RepID=A0A4R1KSL0_9FLAO|nr:YtxH domain-containing protein [Winogradskyella wandonensis]TCK68045.1 putative membrane protein [Winogradskyella wandonensis]
MSEDNKNLSDDLDDMIGDVKEGAKKAGKKISQKASELADDAKELSKEAKEKASEFANEAKEKASEFADEAKEVFSDGKNVGIISHIYWIGWIIALIMNSNNKSELGSFYLRQNLGLFLLSFLAWIPFLGWLLGIAIFVAWIISLIGALSGQKKPTFLLGNQFQEWFKAL